MFSVCLHLVFWCQNCPKYSLQIDVSDELKLINVCQQFIMFFATWALRWLLNCLHFFVRFLSNIYGLEIALVPPQPAHSCQNCCNLYSKNAKNGRKTREFALFTILVMWMAVETLLNHLLVSNQLFLGSRWRWYLYTLPVHSKIVAIDSPKMQKKGPQNQRVCSFLPCKIFIWLFKLY